MIQEAVTVGGGVSCHIAHDTPRLLQHYVGKVVLESAINQLQHDLEEIN